jgi:hypothetical protein
MPADSDPLYCIDGASTVVVDSRHWPVVFATWFDEPTERLVRSYFDNHAKLLERARANREPFVLVTDTFATKQPSAKARKLIADLTNAQPAYAATLTIGSIIVIENAILRGVVTALRWILPRMADSESIATIGAAVDRSLQILDRSAISRPSGLSAQSYRRPPPHAAEGPRSRSAL